MNVVVQEAEDEWPAAGSSVAPVNVVSFRVWFRAVMIRRLLCHPKCLFLLDCWYVQVGLDLL